MVWFFLNLLLLAAVFLLIFGLNLRFEPWSPLSGGGSGKVDTVARLVSSELDEKSRAERDQILDRYSQAYGVEFFLFDSQGTQLGGETISLPENVNKDITADEGFGPNGRPQMPANNREPRGLPPPGPSRTTSFRSSDPTFYWVVIRTIIFDAEANEPIRSRLIVRSDSFYGHGLYYDPRPWVAVGAGIILFSILFWLPFVRNITRSIGRLTAATEKIADEDFPIRVDDRRTDELGKLGTSINELAGRLSGFVNGQRRFLGDISHELNSPLARMQFALSILEERSRPDDLGHINDVKEEVELMSKLVAELLSYSKSGIQGAAIKLEPLELLPVVERLVSLESKDGAAINVAIDGDILVMGQSELLTRAISNIIRNAKTYSGEDGAINIAAVKKDSEIVLTINDNGPGVPDEMLEKIFDPLFRVQDDRSRTSGGTGLGLAIVKTCIDACGGKVSAKNVEPHGLEIEIDLKSA